MKALKIGLLLIIGFNFLQCQQKENSNIQLPSIAFRKFVHEIEKEGWASDTVKVKQLNMYNLNSAELRMQKNLPFYALSFEDTRVDQIIDGKEVEALSNVEQIWAYYYNDKTHQYIVSDGVIEEWQFEDAASAEAAFNAFNIQKTNLYFNTEPYFYQIKSSVYVFHSRAMAFSIDQKGVFEKFVKQNPTKENGK